MILLVFDVAVFELLDKDVMCGSIDFIVCVEIEISKDAIESI